MNEATLDTRNLNCPLPILLTRKRLNDLSSGDTLEVIATDPGSMKDIESFCRQTYNVLVSTSQRDGQFTFVIRKT